MSKRRIEIVPRRCRGGRHGCDGFCGCVCVSEDFGNRGGRRAKHRGLSCLGCRRLLPLDLRTASWEEELQLMAELHKGPQKMVGPTVQLGFGRATLAHKFQAIMHAFLLMSPNVAAFVELVGSVVSWTSDYGVEVGFSRILPLAVADVFPFLQEHVDESGGEVDFAADPPAQEETEVDFAASIPMAPSAPTRLREAQIDVSHSFEVPGVLHILHNAGRGLRCC